MNMRTKTLILALTIASLGALALAQTSNSIVYDDDGGHTQAVLPPGSRAVPPRYHGGLVLEHPVQQSVFLGEAWAEPSLRQRELELENLGSTAGGTLGGSAVEDFRRLESTRAFDDLDAQRELAGLFGNRTMALPGAETVIVIYLPPGQRSALGVLQAGRDYVAYHNFFHILGREVHYVVVPYNEDAQQLRVQARTAFRECARNPNGHGWY